MAKRAKARKGRSGSKRKNTQRVLVWLYVGVAAVLVFFGVRFALDYHDYVNVRLRDVSA